jgi:TolB-like protein
MRGRTKGCKSPSAVRAARGIYNGIMANLTLVYGMRLLPADEIVRVGDAPVELKNGNQAQVTMHVLEGSREQIETQLRLSLDAFFDFYPEI